MKTTTYSAARERLASLIEDVIATREVALITRQATSRWPSSLPKNSLACSKPRSCFGRRRMPDGFCKPFCGFTKAVTEARK